MERCITQLEEGEKAREMTGCVNCISTNTPRAGWRTLNEQTRGGQRGEKKEEKKVLKKSPETVNRKRYSYLRF